MIHIHLLGPPSVRRGDDVLGGRVAQRHPMALLALLALSPDGRMSRDKLVGVLWPDASPESARGRLNTTVHAIRSALGREVLESAAGDLVLADEGVQIDVRTFRHRREAGELAAAVDGYRGPLLDGFHLGSSPFEHWLDGARRTLEEEHAETLELLAREAETDADTGTAAEWWGRLAEVRPLSERVASRLVAARAAAGDVGRAIQGAERFARRVEEELGSSPSPDFAARVDMLQSPGSPPDPPADRDRTGEPAPANRAPTATGASPGLAAPSEGLRRRPEALLLAVAVLIALVVALARGVEQPDASSVEVSAERVAVLPLENRTGDPELAPVGRLAADWVVQSLARAGLGVVLPLSDLLQSFQPGIDPGAVTVAEAREAAEASVVVKGSVYRFDDELEFRLRVLDSEDGRVIDALDPVRASVDDPRDGVARLGERAAGTLASVLDPREVLGEVGEGGIPGHPPTLDAYRAFADGLDRFFRLDFEGAYPLFLRAAELDTTFQRATLRALETQVNLGRFTVVDSLLTWLEARRELLLVGDRLLLETARAHLAHERDVAMERTDRLAEMYPNSYMVYQAAWQGVAYNRPRRAVFYLARMDPVTGPMSRWRGYWGVYTSALHMLDRHEEEPSQARRARRLHPRPEETDFMEVRALAALGRLDTLRRMVDEQIQERPGLAGAALVLRVAAELQAHGYTTTATGYLAEAIALFRALPIEARVDGWQIELGLRYRAGDWARAREIVVGRMDSTVVPTDGPSRRRYLSLHGRLGTLAARVGDLNSAREADAWLARVDWPYTFGEEHLWRARIHAVLGQPEEAMVHLRQGLAAANHGLWLHRDPDLLLLRDHPGFRALLRPRGP